MSLRGEGPVLIVGTNLLGHGFFFLVLSYLGIEDAENVLLFTIYSM